MTEAAFLALIATARWIISQAPVWAEALRKKGELSASGEAAYQEHQQFVFSKPSSQPEPALDPTKPDV